MFLLQIFMSLLVLSTIYGQESTTPPAGTPSAGTPPAGTPPVSTAKPAETPTTATANANTTPGKDLPVTTTPPAPAKPGEVTTGPPGAGSSTAPPKAEQPEGGNLTTTEKTDQPNHAEGEEPEEQPSEYENNEQHQPKLTSEWEKLPKECGKTKYDKQPKSRIINGDKANLGQFPWIARLGTKEFGEDPTFFCGGTLISEYYVVSAAHCDTDFDIVRLGENDLSTPVDCNEKQECAPPHQDIPISKFIFQDYCRGNIDNDIMLIELEHKAEFNDFVLPACLLRRPIIHDEFIGKKAIIAGFGLLDTSGTPSDGLYFMSNTVVDPEECKETPTPLGEGQFCIGTPGVENSNGTCNGDAGGPVMQDIKVNGTVRTHLIGVISYGVADCDTGPGVYTDVSYYGEWIVLKMTKY